jgi:hypothetical protein
LRVDRALSTEISSIDVEIASSSTAIYVNARVRYRFSVETIPIGHITIAPAPI